MKRIDVVNMGLIFHKTDYETDLFIEQSIMDGAWGSPEEIDIDIYDWKSTRVIMAEIFATCGSQEQQLRIVAALDKKASFATALDSDNYDLARLKMHESYTEGLITEADMQLVNSIIPSGEVIG